MRTARTFSFARFQQPGEAAWAEVGAFAKAWNQEHETKFSNIAEILWSIEFPDANDRALAEFLGRLCAVRSLFQISCLTQAKNIFSECDYRAADFFEILGVNLVGADRRFVLNEAEALGPPVPCPECGWRDMFDKPQLTSFVIEESLLDASLPTGEHPPPGGWDCVNLPNGHKVVARRVVALLDANKVKGYELLPVLTSATNQPSERVVQILAHKAIPVLRPVGDFEGALVLCNRCGAARSLNPWFREHLVDMQPMYCVGQDEVSRDEIFSRHLGRGAMLYVPGRVYGVLIAAYISGIVAAGIVQYCKGDVIERGSYYPRASTGRKAVARIAKLQKIAPQS